MTKIFYDAKLILTDGKIVPVATCKMKLMAKKALEEYAALYGARVKEAVIEKRTEHIFPF